MAPSCGPPDVTPVCVCVTPFPGAGSGGSITQCAIAPPAGIITDTASITTDHAGLLLNRHFGSILRSAGSAMAPADRDALRWRAPASRGAGSGSP
jgi:hypothetical protein